MVKIAPSLMCMDLSKFSEQINFLNQVVDEYHIDIMDGHYVQNMTLSPWFIEQLKQSTTIPMDAHLMVTNPMAYVQPLVELGVDIISIHAEFLNGHAFRTIETIHKAGKKVGVVLNPETPLAVIADYLNQIDVITVMTVDPGFAGQKFIQESLAKIANLAKLRAENQAHSLIQIDGSCNKTTYTSLLQAGADMLVVGSSGLFGLDANIKVAYQQMLRDIKSARS